MDEDPTNLVTVPASDTSSSYPIIDEERPTSHFPSPRDQAIVLFTGTGNQPPPSQEPPPTASDQHGNKRKRTEPLPMSNHPVSPSQRSATHPEAESTPRYSVYSTPPDHNANVILPVSPRSDLSSHHPDPLSPVNRNTRPLPMVTPRNRTPSHTPQTRPPPTPEYNIPDSEITGFLGDNPLTGMVAEMKEDWKSFPGPKALAYPHDASYSEDDKGHIAEQMEKAIAEFLSTQRPMVTAPKAARSTEAKRSSNRRPWCYLISNLSEESIDLICAESFISNTHATLHVLRFDPPPSHYVGRIRNLTHDASQRQAVESLIKETILTKPDIKCFILDFTASHHDLIPHEVLDHGNILTWTVDSIRAYHIQKEGKPGKSNSQWKWYIFTPTRDPEHVATWTTTLLGIEFNASAFGWGDSIADHKCVRCKSTNHTEDECPFTKRSDFVQPPLNNRKTGDHSRGGRRGRGNRGGRGGRRAIDI